jgi:hypothetical protein
MYKINFNKKDNLLEVKVVGEITVDDMLNYIRQIGTYLEFTDKLYIFQDSRNIEPKLDLFDIPVVANEFEKVMKKFKFIKHADIHHLPASTAYALIYQYNTQFTNYKYEIFNTQEAAEGWLLEVVNIKLSDDFIQNQSNEIQRRYGIS